MIIKTNPPKPRKKKNVKNPCEKFEKPFEPLKRKLFQNRRVSQADSIPSLNEVPYVEPKQTVKQEYTGEMLEREKAAQEEIERKKKRVAPLFSKGAYQYITDDELVRDLGKKV